MVWVYPPLITDTRRLYKQYSWCSSCRIKFFFWFSHISYSFKLTIGIPSTNYWVYTHGKHVSSLYVLHILGLCILIINFSSWDFRETLMETEGWRVKSSWLRYLFINYNCSVFSIDNFLWNRELSILGNHMYNLFLLSYKQLNFFW